MGRFPVRRHLPVLAGASTWTPPSPPRVLGQWRLRAAGRHDSFGVEEATRQLSTALRLVDEAMASKKYAMDDEFTMADCAAAPALWYREGLRTAVEQHERPASWGTHDG